MKKYLIEFSAVLEIEAETEDEAIELAADQVTYADLSLIDVLERPE